jgi:hypothetical protein
MNCICIYDSLVKEHKNFKFEKKEINNLKYLLIKKFKFHSGECFVFIFIWSVLILIFSIFLFKKVVVFVVNAVRLLTMMIIYVNAVDVITKIVLMKDGRSCITMKRFLVIFVEIEHVSYIARIL